MGKLLKYRIYLKNGRQIKYLDKSTGTLFKGQDFDSICVLFFNRYPKNIFSNQVSSIALIIIVTTVSLKVIIIYYLIKYGRKNEECTVYI